MKKICVSAPAKLHLIGEHTVVYGAPAILAAINKRCTITISEKTVNSIEIIAGTAQKKIISVERILQITREGRRLWDQGIKNGNFSSLQRFLADPCIYPLLVIGETLEQFNVKQIRGFSLRVSSDIPIGSGMGSSAALAVAIAGAVSMFVRRKKSLDKQAIFEIAFRSEQKMHGNPSGGDIAACLYGGLLWFQKINNKRNIIPLHRIRVPTLNNNLYVVHTGRPEESTGVMVGNVKAFKEGNQKSFEKICASQENLVALYKTALEKDDVEGSVKWLQQSEKNLELLGVVSSQTKKLIRSIEKADGVAKISGAGGSRNASGILLVYTTEKNRIEKCIQKSKFSLEQVQFDSVGLQVIS